MNPTQKAPPPPSLLIAEILITALAMSAAVYVARLNWIGVSLFEAVGCWTILNLALQLRGDRPRFFWGHVAVLSVITALLIALLVTSPPSGWLTAMGICAVAVGVLVVSTLLRGRKHGRI